MQALNLVSFCFSVFIFVAVLVAYTNLMPRHKASGGDDDDDDDDVSFFALFMYLDHVS